MSVLKCKWMSIISKNNIFLHVHCIDLARLHFEYECMLNFAYAANASIYLHYVLEKDRLETKTFNDVLETKSSGEFQGLSSQHKHCWLAGTFTRANVSFQRGHDFNGLPTTEPNITPLLLFWNLSPETSPALWVCSGYWCYIWVFLSFTISKAVWMLYRTAVPL